VPLRDHFRSPVADKHTWDTIHGGWPMMIVQQLFDILPPGYIAAPTLHLGSPFEIDVSTYEDADFDPDRSSHGIGGGVTLAVLSPTLTVEAELNEEDVYEVRVYDEELNRKLVAAIEIVSPSNKDRPEKPEIFIGKVAALLRREVCVSIIDLVSTRHANLYAGLLASLGRSDPQLPSKPQPLYAVTLRTRNFPERKQPLLDAWYYPMAIGEPLPTLPIWLSPELRVMLPLESSYEQTCRLLHIK